MNPTAVASVGTPAVSAGTRAAEPVATSTRSPGPAPQASVTTAAGSITPPSGST